MVFFLPVMEIESFKELVSLKKQKLSNKQECERWLPQDLDIFIL